MSDAVTREELLALCDEHERLLRAQRTDGTLDPALEEELGPAPTTAMQAITRLVALKMAYRSAWKGGKRPAQDDGAAQEAARQLLTREPVRLRLENGRSVAVTGRGYLAMREIAARGDRLKWLEDEMQDIHLAYAAAHSQRRAAAWLERRSLTRKLRRLEELHRRTFNEWVHHRERLLATAFTPNGEMARPDQPAPTWWEEVTPVDEARIIAALFEAGPGRYHSLGPPPAPAKEKRAKGEREAWGWHTLLASIEQNSGLDPSQIYDEDFFRLITRERGAALPSAVEGD